MYVMSFIWFFVQAAWKKCLSWKETQVMKVMMIMPKKRNKVCFIHKVVELSCHYNIFIECIYLFCLNKIVINQVDRRFGELWEHRAPTYPIEDTVDIKDCSAYHR